jgi:hypothetical protein
MDIREAASTFARILDSGKVLEEGFEGTPPHLNTAFGLNKSIRAGSTLNNGSEHPASNEHS